MPCNPLKWPWALRFALFVLALLLATQALAGDLVARQGSDSVRLTDKPCPILDAIVNRVPQGARGYLRLAQAEFQGAQYTACYAVAGGAAYLWYEDGDEGVIPEHDFKPALDI